jgi:AraC family transcriptional regulator
MIDYGHTDEWRIPVLSPLRLDRTVSQPAPPSVLPQAIIAQGKVTRREDRPAVITTQALSWPGVMLEAGTNNVTEADTVVLNQHFISLNIDTNPLTLEVKGAHGFRRYTVPPQTVWICPAADPISLYVNSTFSYVRMSIDAPHLDRLLGHSDDANPVRLRRMFGVAVPQITHLVKTLRAEADNQNPGGLAVVDAVTTALGHLLVRHVGIDQPRPTRLRGGLSPMARRRTLEVIHSQLDSRLTIDMLAREAGLSVAHFSRAFRETMGRAPHQYLLSMRLEKARRLLEAPDANLSDVAHRTGFADQAHFTRLFKRSYGITPGALVRQRTR